MPSRRSRGTEEVVGRAFSIVRDRLPTTFSVPFARPTVYSSLASFRPVLLSGYASNSSGRSQRVSNAISAFLAVGKERGFVAFQRDAESRDAVGERFDLPIGSNRRRRSAPTRSRPTRGERRPDGRSGSGTAGNPRAARTAVLPAIAAATPGRGGERSPPPARTASIARFAFGPWNFELPALLVGAAKRGDGTIFATGRPGRADFAAKLHQRLVHPSARRAAATQLRPSPKEAAALRSIVGRRRRPTAG